jgi:hypothetical protein
MELKVSMMDTIQVYIKTHKKKKIQNVLMMLPLTSLSNLWESQKIHGLSYLGINYLKILTFSKMDFQLSAMLMLVVSTNLHLTLRISAGLKQLHAVLVN